MAIGIVLADGEDGDVRIDGGKEGLGGARVGTVVTKAEDVGMEIGIVPKDFHLDVLRGIAHDEDVVSL